MPFSWETSPYPLLPTPTHQGTSPPDAFTLTASRMAVLHNIYIRTLNAIYLQSPHIPPQKTAPFLTFCRFWADMIKAHHDHEEMKFFPDIENAAGEEGLMGENVRQHAAFIGGLETFRAYIAACEAGEEEFSGAKLRSIIDSFGAVVTEHLADEIPTLLALRKYPELDIQTIFDETGKLAERETGIWDGKPMFAAGCDVTFEGGRWKDFPAVPWVGRWVLANVAFRRHRDVWEFACCDMWGMPRELKYLGKE